MIVAPASAAARATWQRKSMSVRLASSAENSTSSQCSRAEAHHFSDLGQRLRSRNTKLVLQVQIGRGKENVQPRFGGGFESTEGRIDVVLPCARKSGDAAILDFAGDCSDRVKVARARQSGNQPR